MKLMAQGAWTRKEHTTKGADPTVVVTWTCEMPGFFSLEVQEFQGVYRVKHNGKDVPEEENDVEGPSLFNLAVETVEGLEAFITNEDNLIALLDENHAE